ncbi:MULTISPECIES: metallophosphoesterase [unclassified Coleofasciculus]|uniref:metallophosphoesterase n=1 Tax=unclassified Coleofasciculus TaxID=2692782 RepID=UPI001882F01B|nr:MULTISPECIES: metallophosphoesterase [unclassified Coleofasciculus]MBE9128997.1 metallophosphoesterase [Coleofasciculus sp. LEGE 07081]MBE9151576.1 metallophosphoesterase [Coleofasciculus sp. LEGE 07092]
MSLNRRQFLVLTGFGSLGLIAAIAKSLPLRTPWSTDVDRAEFDSLIPDSTTSATPLSNSAEEELLLRFVSVADTGTGATGQYAVARAMAAYHQQNPYDLIILAGDNIYNNGEIEKIDAVFEKPYQALLQQGVKFHACLGNHDIRTANGDPQVRYPGFNMQGRYYTFRREDVQFFALDTNYNADWQNQLPWLEQELSRSDAPWKIVFGHHQIYSSGHYGVNRAFIQTLTPLFQQYQVSLYINGHDHSYERTQLINGTTYLICGAGAGTRPIGRSEWTAYSAARLSFAAVEVYRNSIVISGIGTDGQVFDQGIIKRQSV